MGVPSARTGGALYQVILPHSAREQIMADLKGKNINHEELLPNPDHLEALCTELRTALTNSQSNYGHFRWKVEVLPQIKLRGLNAIVIDK